MGRSRSSRVTADFEGGEEASAGGGAEAAVAAGTEERDAAANARPLKKRDSRHKGADAAEPDEAVVEDANGTGATNGEDNDPAPAEESDSDTDEEYEVGLGCRPCSTRGNSVFFFVLDVCVCGLYESIVCVCILLLLGGLVFMCFDGAVTGLLLSL